jgi:hypothetical protein
MNSFTISDVGSNALQINFEQPYNGQINKDIHYVLNKLNAQLLSSHHNSYIDENYSWYSMEDKKFTFSDLWRNLRIFAQGNNLIIFKIEKAVLESGLFEKMPSSK